MQKKDEHWLISQSLNENHQAYAELVNRYKDALYRHSFAIVRDEDVAEDITQDSFITAYYKLSQYNPAYKFSTWLFKLATNKALNWLKKTAREVAVDDELIARIARTQPNPAQSAEMTELHAAVDKLQPKYRAIISLYYWQGLTYSDIAATLNTPEGSIKGWMYRAKAELKKGLL